MLTNRRLRTVDADRSATPGSVRAAALASSSEKRVSSLQEEAIMNFEDSIGAVLFLAARWRAQRGRTFSLAVPLACVAAPKEGFATPDQ